MPFENVAANYGEMNQTAATFNAKVAELESMLSQIQNMIVQVSGTWVGQGYTSFSTIMADWNTSVTQLNRTLGEISANVNRSATAYSDTDTAVARGFQGFQTR
jgi:WXG100 family type VII secretion target